MCFESHYQQSEPASANYLSLARPTLLSAIIHMMALIALALLTLDQSSDTDFELTLAATDDLAEEELSQLELAEFDTATVDSLAASEVVFEPVGVVSDISAMATAVEPFEIAPPSNSLIPIPGGDGLGEGRAMGARSGRISVFGLAGEGSKFVYVFDRSKSMTSTFRLYDNGVLVSELTPLMLAKAEMVRSLQALSADDRFQIVFYNERPLVFDGLPELRRLFTASEAKKSEAQQFVINMPAEGSTNHSDAMKLALRLKPDVVFLITDGEEKDDLTTAQVRALIKSCKDDGVTVHLVHFAYESRPDSTLVRLATETGGQHRFIDLRDLAGFNQPGNL